MTELLQRGTSGQALMVAVVPQGVGAEVLKEAKSVPVKGGFILHGQGAASKEIWERLGIAKQRDIVLCTVSFHKLDELVDTVAHYFDKKKKNTGMMFAVSIEKFLGKRYMEKMLAHAQAAHQSLSDSNQDDQEILKKKVMEIMERYSVEKQSAEENCASQLIIVKMASGYAQEVMDCARKAGAFAGTVLHGRAVLDSSDVKFFNLSIQPDGDILFMLVLKSKADEILDAIAKEHGPTTQTHAIGFVLPVLTTFPGDVTRNPKSN